MKQTLLYHFTDGKSHDLNIFIRLGASSVRTFPWRSSMCRAELLFLQWDPAASTCLTSPFIGPWGIFEKQGLEAIVVVQFFILQWEKEVKRG